MKILVATDGSKPAIHAVKYATKLLRSLSSTSNSITLISVHDDVGLRHAKSFVGKEALRRLTVTAELGHRQLSNNLLETGC